MAYAGVLLIGLYFGFMFHKVISVSKQSGDIIVTQDEDGTYLSLEINSITDITSKKEVKLGVRTQK